MDGPFCSMALAIASRQAFLSAVPKRARSRDAALARRANSVISSLKVITSNLREMVPIRKRETNSGGSPDPLCLSPPFAFIRVHSRFTTLAVRFQDFSLARRDKINTVRLESTAGSRCALGESIDGRKLAFREEAVESIATRQAVFEVSPFFRGRLSASGRQRSRDTCRLIQ